MEPVANGKKSLFYTVYQFTRFWLDVVLYKEYIYCLSLSAHDSIIALSSPSDLDPRKHRMLRIGLLIKRSQVQEPTGGGIFSVVNGVPLHTAVHHHPHIVLI